MASKRARTDNATASDATAALARMGSAAMRNVLQTLVATSADARTAVCAAATKAAAKPLDVHKYRQAAMEAAHCIDNMRPSKQFSNIHLVTDGFKELIAQAESEPTPRHTFKALACVATVAVTEPEGEVRKGVMGCGGVTSDIASSLMSAWEEMSGADRKDLGEARGWVEQASAECADYCDESFEELLEQMDG